MPDMDETTLAGIEQRAEAATEGPWDWRHFGGNPDDTCRVVMYPAIVTDPWEVVADDIACEADAVFIAHARTDVPALVAEVRRLGNVIEEQRRKFYEELALTANAQAERDEARAEVRRLAAALAEQQRAHELMSAQFRVMQREKEHGWQEADRQETRAEQAEHYRQRAEAAEAALDDLRAKVEAWPDGNERASDYAAARGQCKRAVLAALAAAPSGEQR